MVKKIEGEGEYRGSTGKEKEGWLIPGSGHVFSHDTVPVR